MQRSILPAAAAFVCLCLSGRLGQAQPALKQLEKQLGRILNPAETTTEPGYLGLFADNTDAGVVITSVRQDGPAAAAGLRAGDRVITIDGKSIATTDDMAAALSGKPPGAAVAIRVERGGKQQTINVTMGRRPAPEADAADAPALIQPPPSSPPPTGRAVLGINVAPPSRALRLQYGLRVAQGAVIVAVQPGSPAQLAGLPVGAVIVQVDSLPVTQPADLTGYLRTRRPGQQVQLTYYVGERAVRRTVTLAAAAEQPHAATPQPAPPGRAGPARGDVPALQRLEKLIDRFAPPASGPSPDTAQQIEQLRATVHQLQLQVQQLQQRVEQLEQRMPPAAPTDPDHH